MHVFILLLLLWIYSPWGPWPLFQFPNLYTVGRTPWRSDQPVTKPLPTRRSTQTQNKRTQTSMPWVGFEPTTPAFEREKTVHALDRAATVIGCAWVCLTCNMWWVVLEFYFNVHTYIRSLHILYILQLFIFIYLNSEILTSVNSFIELTALKTESCGFRFWSRT
jgi:hypothetical protein